MAGKVQPFNTRQHMLAQGFEIFRYCDSHLEGVALHHHDFYEVYLFLNGNVDYSIESRNYHLLPGDLLLINPMELHQPRVAPEKQPYERIVLWINKAFLQQLSSPQTSLTQCFDHSVPTHTNLLRLRPQQRVLITNLMVDMVRESYSSDYGGDLSSVSLLIQLLVEINRIALAEPQRHELEDKSSDLMARALEYINEHYNEELSLNSLASRFYISKYHMMRRFRAETGYTVHAYLTGKRLALAREQIAAGTPILQAASACGFGDYSTFCRAYRRQFGQPPSSARQDAAETLKTLKTRKKA